MSVVRDPPLLPTMPNTGKPSLACHECRRRRVKCDLGRPGCLRCSKYDLVCPGYRDETDLCFRHSNTDTIKQKVIAVQRRRSGEEKCQSSSVKRNTRNSSSSGSSSEPDIEDPARAAIVYTCVDTLRGLPHDWRSHSHRVVIDCYPWVSALEPLMHGVRQNSPLSLSTTMLARGYLVNRHMLPYSAAEESCVRGTCLSAVRNALLQPELAVKDSTIIAVWLLGTYEVLQGSVKWPPDPEASWRIHHTGLISLVEARGLEQFKTAQGRQIFWLCVETIQIHYNALSQPCPPDLLKWLHRLQKWKLNSVENMALKSAFLSARFSQVYPHMLEAIFSDDADFAAGAVGHLIEEVDSIEVDYADYVQIAKHPELCIRARSQYKIPVGRMKVQNFLFYILNLAIQSNHLPSGWSLETLTARRHEALMTVQSIAESILETAPPPAIMQGSTQIVGQAWSKNMGMMYPFAAICHMQTPRFEQRIRAREVLRFIGHKCGIRQALRPSMGTKMPAKATKDWPYVVLVGPEGIPP